MKLDTATIVILSLTIDLLLVLILLHAWRTRTTYPGFIAWIAGNACWTLGSLFNLLLPDLQPSFIPKILGTALILMHPLLLYQGLIRFYGARRRILGTYLNIALVSANLLNSVYFLYVVDDVAVRNIVTTGVLAFLFGRIAVEPLLFKDKRVYSMQWMMSLLVAPLVVLLLMRVQWFLDNPAAITSVSMALNVESLLRWILFYGIFVEVVISYGYLSLTNDRVEQELREAQKRERAIAEAQRQFFGMVTHEFKTPLAVIDRSAQMIAYTAVAPDEALNRRVAAIRANAAQLIGLLDNCMNDAVMARGELQMNVAEIDLNLLLDEVRERHAEACPERIIELHLPEPASICRGDARILFHLFSNLLDNALKFSSADTPVSIRLTRDDQHFTIAVTDHGIGVPDNELASLGDRSFRASTAQGIPGTGIGLHTAHLIARLHDGSISIDSIPGTGTTLTVALPV